MGLLCWVGQVSMCHSGLSEAVTFDSQNPSIQLNTIVSSLHPPEGSVLLYQTAPIAHSLPGWSLESQYLSVYLGAHAATKHQKY